MLREVPEAAQKAAADARLGLARLSRFDAP
jgi:hypothetical protein